MKRTEAHKEARLAAEKKCISLERLTFKALSSGIFIKPGTEENYSMSWIKNRLKLDDRKVSKKLIEFADTI